MAETTRSHLRRGDLLPKIVAAPPGPRSLELSARLVRAEPPGINTLYRDQPNIVWHEALGSNVLDVDGNRYIDLTSGFGVAAVGHRHQQILGALHSQSRRLVHGLGDANGHELRIDLAERLNELAPMPEAQTYFAVSGADAVEIALKTALLYSEKPKFLAFEPSYHGLTLGALSATSRPAFREPFKQHLHDHCLRLPFGCPMAELEKIVAEQPDLGAILFEPIVGREGVLVPPRGWLSKLTLLARRSGILTIADEVFTGGGRTGRFFAVEEDSPAPDLIACGKAIAGGLPIGAVLGRREIFRAWKTSGEALHTATFVAHPLACASALATLDLIHDLGLVSRAVSMGEQVGGRCSSWPGRYRSLSEVRGRGLLWGLEMSTSDLATQAMLRARSKGLLLLAGGPNGTVLQLAPALTIARRQLDFSLDILEEIFQQLSGDRR